MGTARSEKWKRKVEWMREHRDIWEGLDANGPLYLTERNRWKEIVYGLRDAGLISRATSLIDVPVRDLIKAAALPDPPEVNK